MNTLPTELPLLHLYDVSFSWVVSVLDMGPSDLSIYTLPHLPTCFCVWWMELNHWEFDICRLKTNDRASPSLRGANKKGNADVLMGGYKVTWSEIHWNGNLNFQLKSRGCTGKKCLNLHKTFPVFIGNYYISKMLVGLVRYFSMTPNDMKI